MYCFGQDSLGDLLVTLSILSVSLHSPSSHDDRPCLRGFERTNLQDASVNEEAQSTRYQPQTLGKYTKPIDIKIQVWLSLHRHTKGVPPQRAD